MSTKIPLESSDQGLSIGIIKTQWFYCELIQQAQIVLLLRIIDVRIAVNRIRVPESQLRLSFLSLATDSLLLIVRSPCVALATADGIAAVIIDDNNDDNDNNNNNDYDDNNNNDNNDDDDDDDDDDGDNNKDDNDDNNEVDDNDNNNDDDDDDDDNNRGH
jgi:hypothetical protein